MRTASKPPDARPNRRKHLKSRVGGRTCYSVERIFLIRPVRAAASRSLAPGLSGGTIRVPRVDSVTGSLVGLGPLSKRFFVAAEAREVPSNGAPCGERAGDPGEVVRGWRRRVQSGGAD